jgi:cobaltochelatase CobN
MADILPTGRNFYSVDPLAIPSAAAWTVGMAQADAWMERFLKTRAGILRALAS